MSLVRRWQTLLAAGLVLLLGGGLAQAVPMGPDDARHLLERTGFGAPPAAVAEYARLSHAEAVARLLRQPPREPLSPPPASAREFVSPRQGKGLDEAARKEWQRRQFQSGVELRAWWLGEMLAADPPRALAEHMTLFWHNHFVSSQQKVKATSLMAQQNLLLRRHALGSFSTLVHEVAKDPAMIIYLDSATNRRGQPNENFAREVMELFTLGEGHYTEQDVKEAARAFTGWSIDPATGDYRWRPFAHDDGEKTVLGQRGNFDGDQVLDILQAQPATAEFISAKLWREFVSPDPEPVEIKRIARRFRDSGYDIRRVLGDLLASRAFWRPENRGVLVKSPVELVVGTLRTLEVRADDGLPLVFAVRNLGQDLFAPPNVRGWPGGETWINSTTLLGRKQFLERLLRSEGPRAPGMAKIGLGGQGTPTPEADALRQRLAAAMAELRFDSRAWLAPYADGEAVRRALMPLPPVEAVLPTQEAPDIALVRALLLDPVFQLK